MAIVKLDELAQAAGVSRSRISQWAREGMPKIKHGQYDAEACLAWIAERRDDSSATSPDLKTLRARLYRLQGDAQEIRNDVLRADLLLAETVETALNGLCAAIVEYLEQWASEATGADEQHQRREVTHRVRDGLAGHIEDIRHDLAVGRDIAVTRIRHGRRVGR